MAQFERECSHWKNVLHRVVHVLKFLCERDHALSGKNEIIGSVNNGNFLGVIEFFSKYDSFLAYHKYVNKGTGHASYLSSTIYEESVQIMATKLMTIIIEKLKTVKYFSRSVDSTPDIKHID